ncbi:hypothetical protein BDR07DRAFT_1419467, partial [Suillus spraguei]
MHLARPRVVAVTELHRLFTHIIHIVRAVYPLRPDHGFKPRMFQTIHMLCNSRYSNRHSFNFRTLLSLHSIYLVSCNATSFCFHIIIRSIHTRGPSPFCSI